MKTYFKRLWAALCNKGYNEYPNLKWYDGRIYFENGEYKMFKEETT